MSRFIRQYPTFKQTFPVVNRFFSQIDTKLNITNKRTSCAACFLTTFWRHLWSNAEKVHGNMESVLLTVSFKRNTFAVESFRTYFAKCTMHTEKHTSKVEKNKQTKPTLYYDCIQKKRLHTKIIFTWWNTLKRTISLIKIIKLIQNQ